MKDIYIADLANFDEGKLFDGFFLVLAKQQRTTKTNKPYLNLILGDKTGQLEGRVWEPGDPRIAKDFERGDIVKARGSASRFDDRLQMKIDQLRWRSPARWTNPTCCPPPPTTWPTLWRQLLGFVESFTNPDLKLLLTTMLADPALARPIAKPPPPSSSSRLAGRPAGARGQPAHPGRPRRAALPASSTATCCSPA
jgi:3'-5' exoribonuclease